MPTSGPDYVLRWPVDIFVRETRAIASIHNAHKLQDAARYLLEEAMTGSQPVRDLEELGPTGAWTSVQYDAIKAFLNQLADDALDEQERAEQITAVLTERAGIRLEWPPPVKVAFLDRQGVHFLTAYVAGV